MNEEFDVFLSFEGDIRQNILDIKTKLNDNKIKPFYDNDYRYIIVGEEADIKLYEFIKNSLFFIPFISIKYNEQFWPKKEIKYARSVDRPYDFIVPIIIGEKDKKKINRILEGMGIPCVTGYLAYDVLSDENITDIINTLSKKVEEFKKNNTSYFKTKEYANFIPLEQKKYEEYYKRLTQRDKQYNLKYFHYKREDLIEEIKKKLDDKKFVFIKGPLLSGKTELIKSFKEKYSKNYKVIGTTREVNRRDVATDRFSLYHYWYKIIYEEILDDLKIKRRYELPNYKTLKNNFEKFKKKLEDIRDDKYLNSYLVAFLTLVDNFKKEQNYGKGLVVAVHLDNMHYYADSNAFEELKNDIDPILVGDTSIDKNIKTEIIIATRYFPLRLAKYVLVNVGNLSMNDVVSLINVIDENINIEEKKGFIKKIFEYTNGQVWFVNRFLKCYLKLRTDDTYKNIHPIKLADELFDNQIYWVDDAKLFKANKASEFQIEIKKIIEKHFAEKDIYFQFINSKESPIILSDEKFTSNLIVKESGYGIFSLEDEEIIEKFNNKLLKKYFDENYLKKIITFKNK